MPHEDVVNESQSTAFSTQTSIANTGKVRILVKAFALENSYNALILHPSVGYNGIQDNLAVCVYVLQVVPSNILEELRDGEESTTGQPSTNIIMTDVVKEASGRNCHDVVLQVLQVVYTNHFLHGIRVAEYKIAKAEETLYKATKVDSHFLGVLVDEVCMALVGQLSFFCLR